MVGAVTVEVTFLPTGSSDVVEHTVAAAGVVLLPREVERPFSGWMELISILEEVAVAVCRTGAG